MASDMRWISFFFFGVAGLIHLGFFVFESFLIKQPKYQKALGLSQENFKLIEPWAFNQGFYNLFLSVGIFMGLNFVLQKQIHLAGLITSFCGFSMIAAGLVLYISQPRLRRWALVQMIPPMLGFFFLMFHILPFLKS